MRVVFLIDELGRSGGMAVIGDLARHLRAHEDIDCELLVCASGAPLPRREDGVPVRRLADAADEIADVAIATWWTTAEALWELPAGCRAVLMQSPDYRYYRDDELGDRLGAEAVLDLPVHWLVVSESLRRVLHDLRPDARSWLVPPGIDKAVFAPAPAPASGGPLRVLVEGQPSMWFKGVRDSIAAVRAMATPASVTLVSPDASLAADLGADRVVGGLAPMEMASLYAEHDVLLKLSRFEGLGLPVLEALHVGLPCVVTPFGGAADLIEHGANGLIVGFDDAPGVVAALERLASDDALRSRMREQARAAAARWPGRDEASAAFASAVRDIAGSEPPDAHPSQRALARGRRRGIEALRELRRREQLEVDGIRGEVSHWQDAWRDATDQIAEYDHWARDLQARIDRLQGRPGFRVEERLRRLGRRGG